MVVIICILTVLLIISLLALIFVFNTLKYVVDQNIINNMSIDDLFNIVLNEKNIEKKFQDVILLVSIMYESKNESIAYDFSAYETKNIISVIVTTKEKNPFPDNDNYMILPHQNVYKIKDGGFQWDYRQLL